ncbi:MAG TPA: sigma-70 family RNA polymerase sigma factor [Gemmataceae bacterium]|nr:sigma-70 family RNA polymerase sigma factor [Gemmataceae bacterium]
MLLTDGQLLGRFQVRGDQEAFAVLVQRHGPMVLGVCRRVLRDDHDTEDAFQAAFVVLARKARSIAKQDSVASWLYKVAYRIALRLRSAKVRRREQEQLTLPKETDSGLADVVRRELRQVLDEEVHRLPEKYRAPILLCYLQGQTNEEAAALLHCPTGTIKIRLLRGREMLRKRLVKRGLALSITALLGEALVDMAQAAVPQPLIHAAANAACGGAAPAIGALASGALKSMCLAKLKVAAIVLLTLSLACVADGMLSKASASHVANVGEKIVPPTPVPTFGDGVTVISQSR